MKRAALIAAVLIPAASPALAGGDAHRVGIEQLPVTGDLATVSACTARTWAKVGKARQLQTADGFAVDWGMGGGTILLPSDGPAWITAEFHKTADAQFIRVLYRHPVSQKGVVQSIRNAGGKCFPDDWNRWAASNGAKPVQP